LFKQLQIPRKGNFKAMMKFSVFILIVFSSFSSYGQKKSDTLNHLMSIAENYLRTMYETQNYDSASKIWDDGVLLELKQAYIASGNEVLDNSTLEELIRTAYLKYYEESTGFKILELSVYSFLPDEDETKQIRLLYRCTEQTKRKRKKVRVVLYFISRDRGKSWKIQDSKIIDITKPLLSAKSKPNAKN
jgi:hypothetical protein